ncbi:MAG TPA: RsmE family RNA methyltransferase [Candidatus Binatia bacterium]|jgi:16S rRNA (uracil1498-N3)-methyltransferase|nr:RsmE family RNA methyltransferase [Candidatus Binatia bacterium]
MRIHRFVIDAALASGPLTVRDAGLRNQLENVLRLAPGDALELCDGKGMEASASVLGFGKTSVDFAVDEVRRNAAESLVRAALYLAVLKRENFELAAQKATEAGASRIVPVVSRRTVKTGLKQDRLARIVKEATEQSGRGIVPAVSEPLSFKEALEDAAANDRNIFFELGGSPFAPGPSGRASVGLFIGPEGGWDDAETAAAREHGAVIASLGPRVLRAETAAAVASYLAARSGEEGMH